MSDDNAQNTRERLLRAATEVFAERGFEAASVREICRRAGANVAAVNYHFGDKKTLYASIFDGVFATLREYRTAFLPRSAPPEQRLATYIRSFFEELYYVEEEAPASTHIAAMYLLEMARPTEVLDRIVQDYIAEDAAELRDIVGQLLGPDADLMTVLNCAASVVGQILYYYHAQPLIQRLHPDLPPVEARIEELIEHVGRFSLAGIRGVRSHCADVTRPAKRGGGR